MPSIFLWELTLYIKSLSQRYLMTLEDIQKYDSDNMHSVYDQWPKLASESYNADYDGIEFRDIEHIIFSVNGSILSKLINLIFFLDYTTIYRAVLSGMIPSRLNTFIF